MSFSYMTHTGGSGAGGGWRLVVGRVREYDLNRDLSSASKNKHGFGVRCKATGRRC